MSRLEQARQYLNNPNVRTMLDLIASSEGVKHGYNTGFGNSYVSDLSRHPNQIKTFRQTDGTTNTTSAFGRYQYLNRTWKGLGDKYGLPSDMSPVNQDLGAILLMMENGSLKPALAGDFKTAARRASGTWVSLPGSTAKQPKHDISFVDNFLSKRGVANTGTSVPYSTSLMKDTEPAKSIDLSTQEQQPVAEAQPAYGGLNLDKAIMGDVGNVTMPRAEPDLNPNSYANPYIKQITPTFFGDINMNSVPMLAALRKVYG